MPAGSGQGMSMTRVRNKADDEQSWTDAMSKRSASWFLKRLSVLLTPLVLVGLTFSSGSAAAARTARTPTFWKTHSGASCDLLVQLSYR